MSAAVPLLALERISTFYGGARIAPSDPYFALASRIASEKQWPVQVAAHLERVDVG